MVVQARQVLPYPARVVSQAAKDLNLKGDSSQELQEAVMEIACEPFALPGRTRRGILRAGGAFPERRRRGGGTLV
jgi:hypothetical protein